MKTIVSSNWLSVLNSLVHSIIIESCYVSGSKHIPMSKDGMTPEAQAQYSSPKK